MSIIPQQKLDNKPDNIIDLEGLKNQLRPLLKTYLEIKGVVFDKKNQFHCFNSTAHNQNDKHASASINPNNNTTFKCFGCGISGDIFTACNLIEGKSIDGKDFIETVKHLCDILKISYQLGNIKLAVKKPDKQLIAEYLYTNENGETIYKVQRHEWTEANIRKKETKPWRNENGKWIPGLDNTEKLLYLLPDVIKAIRSGETIFFVEGEKCADIVKKLGLTATTIPSGANGWTKPHTMNYIKSLVGANVVILPDNDRPGKDFAELVAADIAGVVKSVKIVELPGLPLKGDIEQYLQLGGTKENLFELVKSTREWSRESKVQQQLKSIYVRNNCYYKICKDYDKRISNFILIPLECIQGEGIQEYKALVKTDTGLKFEMQFDLEAFINKSKFKTIFKHPALAFTGGDDDLQNIKVLFGSHEHETKTGVKCVGFHHNQVNSKIFVTDKQAIDINDTNINNFVLLDNYKQISTSILNHDPISRDDLKSLLKQLFSFNSLDKTATILGFSMGCFIKENLWQLGIKFPHLLIAGEAGSGKSQTVESVIMPIFCTENKSGASTSTQFTTLKTSSSSNTIPFIIDEYKPSAIGKFKVLMLSELLRHTYERTIGERGTQSQTINTYAALAPIVLIGEAAIDEPANKERGLELLFSKKAINNNPNYKKNFFFLKSNKHLLHQLGRRMLSIAMHTNIELLKNSYESLTSDIYKKINKSMPHIPDRIVNSIIICLLGLSLIQEMLADLKLPFKETTGFSFEQMEDAILKAVHENIMDGAIYTKSVVDNTLEIMDRMTGKGLYQEGIHYQVMKDGQELALDIKFMYDNFLKYKKEYDIEIESLQQTQFTKQLRVKDYFKDYKTVEFKITSIHETRKNIKKAFVLDLFTLSQTIDIDNFIRTKE